ncbi:hypothetical protein [Archangium primigenium]|uniref:hypothetical protein n=1 Tax=[Archangium] primigenium TaxID=2792470 RepID=UPI00195CFEF3|nr:hypothetical protein [Archangium primigenium]MBM7118266.1 hypothetical protein [Archangium primigenium]
MTRELGFDLDETIDLMSSVIENYAEGLKEREAAKIAQIALLYIRESGKVDELAKYRRWCVDTSFTVEVSHEFATRDEADAWLASGTAQHKERVKIAGKGFMAVQSDSGRWYLMIAPLPEELNSEEWRDDSED